MKEPTREWLLAGYAEKPLRNGLRIDRWSVPSDEAGGGVRS